MRVLLINSNRKVDLLAAPPLGLCYVASATEAAGHEVKVVDLCFTGNHTHQELSHAVRSFAPQVIGLSIRNIDNVNMLHPISYLPAIRQLTGYIREITSVPLVVGGSGASLMPEQVLNLLGADYIIVADGEESFVRLLTAIENKEAPEKIPGVGMMNGGKFNLTPPRQTEFRGGTADLGKWIDIRPYQRIGSSYNIQTKRGCRQQCIYCTYNQALEGNRLRLRSPDEVVDEIEEALFKYHPTTFEFVDAVFNDPMEHSAAIMEEIIRRPWKAEFTAMGVHPPLDKSYLDLMWKAGFRSFMVTPESVSDKMLRSYRKGFSRDDVIHAAEAINKTSFAAWWFFMIGGPGENNDTLQESLDFALKYLQKQRRPVTNIAHFFIGVRIYPNTKLWDIALAEGLIPPQADPLETLWYLSEDLDLDRAVHQMIDAASACPEVYLGFDERVLVFSKPAAMVFKMLGLPRPYWRYFRAANHFGLRTGIRFMYRPHDIPGMLRESLKRQGSNGRPVAKALIPEKAYGDGRA
ncbi:MAG: cobalamin B12-binding domain-containing protein [Desulfomonile tiedjei]|nr:cobalamin B12-binding domain-containing protein [Desulfomonile tiedjei]